AASAQVTTPFADQGMTLGRKGKLSVGALAAIQVAGTGTPLYFRVMAAVRRQLVNAAHDRLPLFAMGFDARAEQLMGDQMGNFMGHGLLEEMFAIVPVQLRVETQQVFLQMRDAGLLPA